MARISYTATEGGMTVGGVFNSETAQSFVGNDPAPDGYASPEELFLTDDGWWILNRVVDTGDPVRSTYELIQPDEARAWLTENNHPEAVKRYFERPKGGRPSIGDRLITTVPARMHNQIAVLSEMYAEDTPDTVRRLLREALAHREEIGAPGSSDYVPGRPY